MVKEAVTYEVTKTAMQPMEKNEEEKLWFSKPTDNP